MCQELIERNKTNMNIYGAIKDSCKLEGCYNQISFYSTRHHNPGRHPKIHWNFESGNYFPKIFYYKRVWKFYS